MLPSGQRQIRGHQSAESSEGMMKRLWNQAVRGNDAGRLPVSYWMDRLRIFNWIQRALRFHRAPYFVIVIGGNGFDPGHRESPNVPTHQPCRQTKGNKRECPMLPHLCPEAIF